MIEGLIVRSLTVNADERGSLTELLRSDDELFRRFGQAYASLNYPGVVRAWHWHEKQWDYWVTVQGMVKAVCFDRRADSTTAGQIVETFMGEHRPVQLVIPPGVAHGYKTIGTMASILINFPTEVYDRSSPDEFRLPFDTPEIPYDWQIKMR